MKSLKGIFAWQKKLNKKCFTFFVSVKLSQIYFDRSKYTKNEGHSYLVEVQFSSSDFETFDDIVLLYVEYDDLLRLEYQNRIKMNLLESGLKTTFK